MFVLFANGVNALLTAKIMVVITIQLKDFFGKERAKIWTILICSLLEITVLSEGLCVILLFQLYDKIRRSEQKYKVALDVLAYHSTCTEDEFNMLKSANLPVKQFAFD